MPVMKERPLLIDWLFCIMEIWKDIPNYEGIYQVSNFGNIKSLKYGKEKILKMNINCHGYLYINLYKEKKPKKFKIHQLVAAAFLNHKPCGLELVVDHINNIKTDNRSDNLQIVTTRFNNCKTKRQGSSKYIGVSFHKKQKRWISAITVNRVVKYVGAFKCETKAHLAYQKALKELV